jgi:tRNA-dihydrouridine synthase B
LSEPKLTQNSKLKTKNLPKKPFWALAPMANITTYPFSSQCINFGADLVWTPMVHTDTILNNWIEASKIINFHDIDNYIIQIVGSDPEKFSQAIKIIEEMGLAPVGYDVNAGCPDKNILKSGCGGALLKDTIKIIKTVKSAKRSTNLPVSVKTRAGYDNYEDIYNLVPELIAAGVSMITIHPRTVKQGYTGSADWEILRKVHSSFFNPHSSASLIGSGDIRTWQEAISRQKETGCDGIMIGRGALGKPWIFKEIKDKADYNSGTSEIKKLALDLSIKTDVIWGKKGIIEARKHYGWYFRGFSGAKEIRTTLMQASSLKEVREILK